MRWTKERDDAVLNFLDGLKWVWWEGKVWWADGSRLREPKQAWFRVYDALGISVGKNVFNSLLNTYLRNLYFRGQYQDKVVVLRPTPSYLELASQNGLWYPVVSCKNLFAEYFLYFMPSNGELKVLSEDSWPQNVYCFSEWGVGNEKSFDPSGTIDDLFMYWSASARDVEEGWELSLALILPALFRQGRVSLMIVGGDSSDQDNFLFRIFRLVDWDRAPIYSSSAYRQVRSLWRQAFIHINFFNRRLATNLRGATLVKLAMDRSTIKVRRPSTDLVEQFTLCAPVFISSAKIKVHEKLATRSLDIHLRDTLYPPYFRDKEHLAPKALMGAFRLFQKAAQVRPPETFDNYIPYVDWMQWAYRYAYVLEVADKLLDYLDRADKWRSSYKKSKHVASTKQTRKNLSDETH